VGFFVPGLGRSTVQDWDVEGSHMAERCGLFIIIALGESILVTGGTFGQLAWTAPTIAAFVVAFVGSVAMWWIYFNVGAEKASRTIAASADPGRLARLAYTYLHLPIVAGIIVSAVADELVLAHPSGNTDLKTAFAVLGGPALYLAGNILFKRAISGKVALSHLAGLGMLTLLIPAAGLGSPLALGAATTSVLVVVAAWETWSLRAVRPQ
jgi:low temperature requirement protein LtrA